MVFLKFDARPAEGGCGPGEWSIDPVPDIILGMAFWEACRIHDRYYKADTDYSRLRADIFTLWKMCRIVNRDARYLVQWILGQVISITYFLGIRLLGWTFYRPYRCYTLLCDDHRKSS